MLNVADGYHHEGIKMKVVNSKIAALLFVGLIALSTATESLSETNPAMVVTFNWRVLRPTCSFKTSVQNVTLDDITDRAFTDTDVRNATPFTVGITCQSGLDTVKIVPAGTPDTQDPTAFANTGTAGNVALRLMDKAGKTLRPDGSSGVAVTPQSGEGSYTFSAGYVATSVGKVTPGSFVSVVSLTFEYD
jgi:minor fimbrial subunit